MVDGSGFRVQGSRFTPTGSAPPSPHVDANPPTYYSMQCLVVGVLASVFWVQSRVQGSRFKVHSSGFRGWVQGLVFCVQGSGFTPHGAGVRVTNPRTLTHKPPYHEPSDMKPRTPES